MISLSICMIVKNEEDVLHRCLTCAKQIADEIIIVDTGSTDNTKKIASKFTNKIYDFRWCYDFSKARNFSFSKATKDYIMWLDADDVILQEDIEKVLNLKKELSQNKDIDMIMLKYNMFDEKSNSSTLSYYRERIFKRENNYKWISPIHEVIPPSGNCIYKDIAITHKKIHASDPKRNLIIFKKMIENGQKLDARQKFYYARELFYQKEYENALNIYKEFLNDKNAWIENIISACIDISDIYLILNDTKNSIAYLTKTFEYDIPRAEVCCKLGEHFIKKNMYNIAIYWYKEALKKIPNYESGGFLITDYYSFIPHIQLCICYDKIKDYKMANYYNELANNDKPNNEFYIQNKKYFNSIITKQ